MIRWILMCAVLLTGCSEAMTMFPTEPEEQADLPENVNIVRVSSKNISNYNKSFRSYRRASLMAGKEWSYKIGVGDIISVTVFEHPELSLNQGNSDNDKLNGFEVQADGTFFFPFIGEISAAEKSVKSVRLEISQKLRTYINDPQVDVRLIAFNSQNVVVSGEVETPNRQSLTTVPLTLLQAVNAAGGWTEKADIGYITLRRNGRVYPVDLRGFLEANMAENNPVLLSGDVVHVPERENQEAFVMGEALRNEAIDVTSELVSLTEAVNEAGGPSKVRSDARGIFVFRHSSGKMNVYQFDTTTPEGWLLGTKFTLAPQDVVFLTRSPLQHWNDTITQLLPTVSAISTLEGLQRNF
ncbi:polysaccharide export outer membrane protein [Shimia gijangensis]|uniref:Polysaccharide export outer membrane protein n=1 Tax=Shimia gijangensis TaxID=1470563 RepID=A0A1M6TMU2_9RHOB|nr:polysaccharide biosynthesis/export family protein [Shimia gijangensis]SHK58223.1 polysaccharide export outer membrane protein [Shimia gijangensis]